MPKRTAAEGGTAPPVAAASDREPEEMHLRETPAPGRPRGTRRPPPAGARRPATRLSTLTPPLPEKSGPGARIRPAATDRRGPGVIRRRRPRRRYVLLGLVVVLLTSGLGAYGVESAGFFRVNRVEVQGAWRVDADEIARATGAAGRDTFTLDTETARRNVERLSGIRHARVTVVWPRRVRVTVEERAPVAVWQIGATGYTVDGDGVVLDFLPDASLPVIYQLDGAPGLLAGDRVDGDTVRLVARLRDAAPALVGQQIARFEWTQLAGLEAVTDRGVRVRLGDSGDLDFKMAVWRGVMERARREKTAVTEIDLRFGDRVAYR